MEMIENLSFSNRAGCNTVSNNSQNKIYKLIHFTGSLNECQIHLAWHLLLHILYFDSDGSGLKELFYLTFSLFFFFLKQAHTF